MRAPPRRPAPPNRRSFTGMRRKRNASSAPPGGAVQLALVYRNTAEKERQKAGMASASPVDEAPGLDGSGPVGRRRAVLPMGDDPAARGRDRVRGDHPHHLPPDGPPRRRA